MKSNSAYLIAKLAILFALSLLFSSCKVKQQPLDTAVKEKTNYYTVFQNVIHSIYKENPDAIGIMAHVECPDKKISWSGGVGFSNKEKNILVQANQPALIASNTKTYVSATILRLVEEGKIQLDQSIESLITEKTKTLFVADGYQLDQITIAHLLSHRSGIYDYAMAESYITDVIKDPGHRWTRDEQIARAIQEGAPQGAAGDAFSYGDINYLLLTEIIEKMTGQEFYTAMRTLINYKKLGLKTTWFYTLEEDPNKDIPRVRQHFTEVGIDSYTTDPSFDLYGGGGIAATTRDLAVFSQKLFTNQIFKDPKTLDLIYTKLPTKDQQDVPYYLGLSGSEINGMKAYGHGGFWGTVVQYIPELNTSIAVYILDRDQRKLRQNVLDDLAMEVQKLK